MILLLSIGLADLIVTAVLHANGLIVEMNPVMRPFIERSEWLFAFVKGATLVLAWIVMARHAPNNLAFVRGAALAGAGVYMFIWTSWFIVGSFA